MLQTSILVVDDERGPRESLNAFLSDLGHAVVSAEDAPSAIREIDQHSFDIIITDKNMPGSDAAAGDAGIQVLKYAAENSPETQVIITTGFATLDSAIEAMKLGAFDYLIKPFSLDKLETIIERIITYRSFINSSQALNSYHNLHNEILQILEKTTLNDDDRLHLLRALEKRIDDFFSLRKRLENIIIEQRDSLANIAMHAAILGEKLGDTPGEETSELLTKIARIAERRL